MNQTISNGKTVWVNDASGTCIGRLSKFGIDVHRNGIEQMEGQSHCLVCKMGPVSVEDWRAFKAAMAKYHQVNVSERHMPMFLREILQQQERRRGRPMVAEPVRMNR